MGKTDRKTLAGLTDKRKLSKLTPHSKVIRKLRESGATLSGVVRFLSTEKQLTVVSSTVLRFIARLEQETAKPQRGGRDKEKSNKGKPSEQAPPPPEPALQAVPPPTGRAAHSDDVRQRINALKQRQPSQEPAKKVFHFNEDEPLTILPGKKGT